MAGRIWTQTSHRLKPLWEGRIVLFFFGLLFTALAALAVVYPPDLISLLNYRTYDALLTRKPVPAASNVPVLIAIDDASLAEFGQWPWPRYRIAQLVGSLDALGAEAIALDMLMPEVDRTSPEVIFAERSRDLGERAPDGWSLLEDQQNDQLFASVLKSTPSVLGYKLLFESALVGRQPMPAPLPQVVVRRAEGVTSYWPKATGAIVSMDVLSTAARAGGFLNAQADPEGVLRRVPLLLPGPDGYHPSLALSALLMSQEEQGVRVNQLADDTYLELNGRQVPLDNQGNLLLAFRGAQKAFEYISAADILTGSLSENHLAGKIAFVGAWAVGLGDRHVTPFDRSYPGLEVHATVVDNLLTGDFVTVPMWGTGAELFFVLLVGLLSTILLARFGFLPTFLLVSLVGISVAVGTMVLFRSDGVYVSPVLPLLVLVANISIISLLKYGIEAQKVYARTSDLVHAQDAMIISMTSLAETRDEETGEHILRTQRYVEVLASRLRTYAKYKHHLDKDDVELIFKSAPLHDIGKVGIPDSILCKKGNLTDEEYLIMKSHTLIGAKSLARTVDRVDEPEALAFLNYARQMAESHHEKWDGSGYPHGLSGEDIPLVGRLMALADVYDALISKRVYKPAFSHEKAKAMILEDKGTHFDPDVVDAFLESEEVFQEVAAKYSD